MKPKLSDWWAKNHKTYTVVPKQTNDTKLGKLVMGYILAFALVLGFNLVAHKVAFQHRAACVEHPASLDCSGLNGAK